MTRVALIDPSLFTLPYDLALANALRNAGAKVDLHGREPAAADGAVPADAVLPTFYRVAARARRVPKPGRLLLKGLDHLISMRRLRLLLQAARPDVIHFQWLPLPVVDARLLAALRRIAPLVLTVHDTEPFNGSPTARLQRLGFAAALAACDRLIVHTSQGASRLAALGIAPARIAQLSHGPLAEPQCGATPDAMLGQLTFVLFGKIKHYKGADLLIEAFAALPPACRAQARLRIVGQPYMNLLPLQQLAVACGIADRVTIEPRFVVDAELPAIFAPGCVAVFPYREIEASGVLSLALAHGRPVIAARIGNFAATLADGVQGNLVPPDDVPALAAAMAGMIADRARTANFAQQAHALALASPGWDEIARHTLGVYAAALAAPRPRALATPALGAPELVR